MIFPWFSLPNQRKVFVDVTKLMDKPSSAVESTEDFISDSQDHVFLEVIAAEVFILR